MSAAGTITTLRRRVRGDCAGAGEPPSLFDQRHRETWGGGPTLDDVIVGAWEGIAARGTATCPVCGGAHLVRLAAAPGRSDTARCHDCGSELG
jgi:hypothetical protein